MYTQRHLILVSKVIIKRKQSNTSVSWNFKLHFLEVKNYMISQYSANIQVIETTKWHQKSTQHMSTSQRHLSIRQCNVSKSTPLPRWSDFDLLKTLPWSKRSRCTFMKHQNDKITQSHVLDFLIGSSLPSKIVKLQL